jgi:uncharacterized protein (DUF1015 family)
VQIRAFRGWRYAVQAGKDLGKLIAPPYDILSLADKKALLARDADNIVAVDLPHVPPKDVGPDSEYQAAAALLAKWKNSGVLKQDSAPALYAYEQTFPWAGRTFTRRALLTGVRVTRLGEDVIPHEHTFAGPKADRLKLTEYTRTQLSPIFGFYSDGGAAARALWAAAAKVQPLVGELDGVTEKVWVITDTKVIAEVTAALKKVPVFIADGHHRCTTTMNYRDALKAAGKIDDNHEANFVLFALVPQDDPGLLILPTHRVVCGLKADFSMAKLAQAAKEFRWQRVQARTEDFRDADAFLRDFGRTAMAYVCGACAPTAKGPGEVWVATLQDSTAMAKAAPQELPVWRELDVAILHKLVIDQALAPWKTDQTNIEYTPDGLKVLAACGERAAAGAASPLGICLQSTPLESVEKIALAGAAMPHKSTYFYPKLATGIVLKPLE